MYMLHNEYITMHDKSCTVFFHASFNNLIIDINMGVNETLCIYVVCIIYIYIYIFEIIIIFRLQF